VNLNRNNSAEKDTKVRDLLGPNLGHLKNQPQTLVSCSSIYRTFCAVEQGKICTFPCRRGGEGAIELVGEGSREALL